MRNDRGQWENGTSGNPNGRPPVNRILTDAIREELNKPYYDTMVGTATKTKLQKLIETLIDEAINGEVNAMKLIWVYVEGLPRPQENQTEAIGKSINKSQDQLPDKT